MLHISIMINHAIKTPHDKINKISLFYVSLVENFWRQWNLDRITIKKKTKKTWNVSGQTMQKNEEIDLKKFVTLAEYLEQQT